ncbi:hypothetical protein L204_102498 [Cryptococcus depauperatus]
MALRLRQVIPGQPNSNTQQSTSVIVVEDSGYVVYPSASNVVLLTPELQLAETLEFWPALPHRTLSRNGKVQGVCCSSPDGYIIAWNDADVVLWRYQPQNNKSQSKWVVHSTIVASSPITCLDFRSGGLALGTSKGIEYWRMDPTAEVVVWDHIWERNLHKPTSIQASPCSGYLAWFTMGQKLGYILTLNRKGHAVGDAQEIRHPQEIQWISWRNTPDGNDPFLYTITVNSVFRIYSPVLDDPMWFQLLYSLDHQSFASKKSVSLNLKGRESQVDPFGVLWIWDATMLGIAIKAELAYLERSILPEDLEEGVRTLKLLEAEGSDIIVWLGPDESVALRSIQNMDRKPPTLLRSSSLSRLILPFKSPLSRWTPQVLLFCAQSSSPTSIVVLPPTPSFPHISSLNLSLCRLLSSKPDSINTSAYLSDEYSHTQVQNDILGFVRTPNGRGLLAIAENGEINTWYKKQLNVPPTSWKKSAKSLLGRGHWRMPVAPSQAAIYSKGRAIVIYTNHRNAPATITLQHLDTGASTPQEPILLPHFTLTEEDEVKLLLAVSDIDDGYDHKGRHTQRAIIIAATQAGEAWVWRIISKLDANGLPTSEKPSINLLSHYRLPLDATPKLILPVDPMGWHQSVIDWETNTPLQDMIVTISEYGDLEFWTPKLGQHLANADVNEADNHVLQHPDQACEINLDYDHQGRASKRDDELWSRTGMVRTGRKNVVQARCSSRKKTVLICELEDGRFEMTIWDSKVSEFSTGLELTHIYESGENIQDLDWTTTSDLQSVLAVGFPHHINIICEQRMSYAETTPGWAPFITINIEEYTSVPINDSIWLAGGSLVVGTGNQIYLFSRFLEGDGNEAEEAEDIFQLIARRNGPLLDYHPILLAQCLLWDKAAVVKNILLKLIETLKECQERETKKLHFSRLDPSEFFAARTSRRIASTTRNYKGLFDASPLVDKDDDDDFTSETVNDLVDKLHGPIQMSLSSSEKSFLATVAQVTLEVESQKRSLDTPGMRYLISIRMSANWDRISGMGTLPAGAPISENPGISGKGSTHLSFRSIVWATHSESQELLLEASTQCCSNGKMSWEDAKRLGVFLWLKSTETMRSQLEIIARNRFMASDNRDPITCSLIFFALGKEKVVHGLWRQALGHQERNLMLKFLANDFTTERWKSAAMKNAYALLSKQRYEYAAAFFMLARSPQDAINVCLKQLDDWHLALALARVVEGGKEGPIFAKIVSEKVVPLAIKGGHRWLVTWAFWMLGRRDLAVRVLISPIRDIVDDYFPEKSLEIGDPDNDDPSLLLMFQHLKAKSLQTAKGTSEIPARLEFDFVLHNARVFFRMGCHNLALDLLRSWSFERPFFPTRGRRISSASQSISTPRASSVFKMSTPTEFATTETSAEPLYHRHRPSFMLAGSGGRHDSLFMDMDVLTESGVSSAAASPPVVDEEKAVTPDVTGTEIKTEDGRKIGSEENPTVLPPSPASPSQRKVGNLMKDLKQNVQQGAMEFSMDNFF